ncbi:MAG: hypothetical protein AAGI25_13355 [Bacteroidota bacterium]
MKSTFTNLNSSLSPPPINPVIRKLLPAGQFGFLRYSGKKQQSHPKPKAYEEKRVK